MAPVAIATLQGDRIGASDCELLREQALAQPLNAMTSLAYVVVGLAVVASARGGHRPLVPASFYGLCLVGVGLGSVSFHGPQPAGSRLGHDLPILLTVMFIVAHDLSLVYSKARHPMVLFGIAGAVATALTLIDIDLGTAATGVGVATIAILEFAVRRRRVRPATRRQRQGSVTMIVVTGFAASSWFLGRSNSPVCDPASAFQFHGLWHVISAVVFGLWWWLAFDARPGPPAPSGPTSPATSPD